MPVRASIEPVSVTCGRRRPPAACKLDRAVRAAVSPGPVTVWSRRGPAPAPPTVAATSAPANSREPRVRVPDRARRRRARRFAPATDRPAMPPTARFAEL